ncbi:MAG TPA: hypothetical protein VF582_04585 [Allosphingosinicella sp.]|jgi:hypothetical protein
MTHEAEPRRAAPFIASSRAGLYLQPGMIRLLSSIFVALALFLSPLAMASGSGMAMSHPAPASAPEAAGHCAGSEGPADEGKAHVKLSCASACAAFLPRGPVTSDEAPAARVVVAMSRPQLLAGIHPEGETPPPRMTPEI